MGFWIELVFTLLSCGITPSHYKDSTTKLNLQSHNMAASIVSNNSHFQELITQAKNAGALCVVDFWANWCEPCQHMNNVFQQLAKSYPKHFFLQVEAEVIDEAAEQYDISSVPTFVFIRNGKEIDRLTGADALMLAKKLENYSSEKITSSSTPQSQDSATSLLNQRLTKLVNYAPVMLFMKGTPDSPQCGFSNKIVEILKRNKIPFSAFNILSDEEVRQGLKDFSNWKTYPQLYIKGELVGGLDIVKELDEEGELKEMVKPAIGAADPRAAINDRLKQLVNSSPVMLFMKGTPDQPKCGYSNQMVALLNDNGVRFGSFDILSDNTVRQALKEYSNWPTYPQLYSNGELVGGLDILKELIETNELRNTLPASHFVS